MENLHFYQIESNPLVSVVVPVFNAHAFLSRCVSSLLAQTYRNIEIILVDDHSTDDSCAICKTYSEEDKRVRFFSNTENHGMSFSQNFGYSVSLGDYICFVDNDDFLPKDSIQKRIALLSKTPIGYVPHTQETPIDESMNTLPPLYDFSKEGLISLQDVLSNFLKIESWGFYHSCLFPRVLLPNDPFPVGRVGSQDVLMWFKLFPNILGINYERTSTYWTTIRKNSQSHQESPRLVYEDVDAAIFVTNYIAQEYPKLQSELGFYLYFHFFYFLKRLTISHRPADRKAFELRMSFFKQNAVLIQKSSLLTKKQKMHFSLFLFFPSLCRLKKRSSVS